MGRQAHYGVTMVQINLPPNINPAILAAALQYLQAQAQQMAPRPSGVLQPHQIRGVNPQYKYEYKEFPKALTPPDWEIKDAKQERDLRVRWRRPLPWSDQADGKDLTAQYYAEQEYPKRETPPQIIVNDTTEEAAVRAAWV